MPNETNNPRDGLQNNQNNPGNPVARRQVTAQLKRPPRKIKIQKAANRSAIRVADSIKAVRTGSLGVTVGSRTSAG
jgi:hypothetical protein